MIAISHQSCVINKHLPPGQILLTKNKVKLISSELTKRPLERDRIIYVVPTPRYGLGNGYLHLYLKHSRLKDSSKWDKFFIKKLSERPMWYTPAAADQTKEDLIKHLNASGYYQGTVDYQVKQKKNRAKVTYIVDAGLPLRIRSLKYISENQKVQRIIDSIKPTLLLKPGMALDEQILITDQAIIIQNLQDRGYYLINKSNFDYYYSDSTQQMIDLECTILPPDGQEDFKAYKIHQIHVYAYDRLSNTTSILDTVVDGINYHQGTSPQVLKPSILKRYIQMSTDSLYRISDLQKTRNTFQNLGIYRSVSVIAELVDEDRLNINLYLPAVKKQFVQVDLESSYVTNKVQVGSNKLLDLRLALQYRHRNLFKGGEQFSLSIIPNLGFQVVSGKVETPWGLNLQANFTIPRFLEIGFARLANQTHLISDQFYRDIKTNARTRINLANVYDLFFNFFEKTERSVQRESKISFGYEFTKDNRIFYRFNPVGFDYLNYDLSSGFIKVAPEFLKKSFEDRLIAGILVKELTADINSQYRNQNSSRILVSFESSGVEAGLIDLFSKKQILSKISRFGRFEVDGRYTLRISGTNQIGLRIAAGIAVPFGEKDNSIPFIRQFYVGGPNSIRGWAIREIGPGLVKNNQTLNRFSFFQTGNFKIEFGSEYRFDIFSILKGAFLFDGGNVWLLKADAALPGGALSTKFLSQLYLSTGFGFRLDFNFFLIRFDSGVKLRTPYLNENGTHNPPFNGLKDLQYNLSLGYPF